MRRSLAVVSLAVTVLVVVAFLVPTALLIRDQAADRALSRAERDAQAIGAALAVAPATGGGEVDPELAAAVLDAFGNLEDFTIVFPDGESVGAPYEPTASIAQAQGGAAFTAQIEGGAEVLVPVLVADAPPEGSSVVVVRTVVSDATLGEGVTTAWLMLGALGIFLVVVAALAADRLGRNIVRPVSALSKAARSLGQGDLDARVVPDGPSEVADVGEAFNFLASRLESLLDAERESVADLSHRLRTPLTALRLQAETLADPDEAAALIEDIGRLERAIDRMIEEARRPSRDSSALPVSDLAAAVRHRALFWKVLADEQGRAVDVHTTGGALLVPISADELGALVDTLIENVFAHTPPGTDYGIWAGPDGSRGVALIVEDHGPGFSDLGVVARGASAGGSTGLGLDIVQRAAVRTGGGLAVGTRPGGGARITVRFGAAVTEERVPAG